MNLHMAATDDGHQLWGVFLDGSRNDGDGGLEIHEAWFMVARSKREVHEALAETVEQTIRRYTNWYHKPTVAYRPVSASELTVCYHRPHGKLAPVSLHEKSAEDFTVTAALMDTRV